MHRSMTQYDLSRALGMRSWFSVLAVAALALSACSLGDGVTPTCTDDLTDKDGNPVASDNREDGCNRYAVCVDDEGKAASPKDVCCKDLKDGELAACLYGFGAGPYPVPTATSGASTSTSTSTSTGTSTGT
jgi:hypothetical protein